MINHKIEIPLTKGFTAIVDQSDYDLVSNYKWFASVSSDMHVYARAYIDNRLTYMHRFIIGNDCIGKLVDHVDRNTLNNQRTNLRICSRGENRSNSRKTKNIHSIFRGVVKVSPTKWAAFISVDNKRIRVGSFNDEIEAAKAYNEAAIKYKGQFASLNDIPSF